MIKKLFCTIIILVCIFLYTYTKNDQNEWFTTEQTIREAWRKQIAQGYWNTYVLQNENKDHELLQQILLTRSGLVDVDKEIIILTLQDTFHTKNFDSFYSLIKDIDTFGLQIINHEKQLSVPLYYGNFYPCKENPKFVLIDKINLKQYIKDSNFSGIASISMPGIHCAITSAHIAHSAIPFSIHSISKVFTQVLLFELIAKNILPEEIFYLPLQIDADIQKLLPPTVAKQLSETTIQQTMIHRAGFGDYTFSYLNNLATKVEKKEVITPIQSLKDFLPYTDDTIFVLNADEARYSNLGILLIGLCIEHYYNKHIKPEKHISFDDILHKYVIQPSGMHVFSAVRPDNGCYNEQGSCSQYICASPAGGHWTTAQDLHAFGIWIQKKYNNNPTFKRLLQTYGHEFYNSETEEIHHSGGIGQPGIGEASARFALFLRQGISVVTLSNKPQQAFTMYQTIYHHIMTDQNKG